MVPESGCAECAHDAELIDRMHAVNLRAPLVLMIKALVPAMIERGGDSRWTAPELVGHGIRVNTVAPGHRDRAVGSQQQIPGVIEEVNGQTRSAAARRPRTSPT